MERNNIEKAFFVLVRLGIGKEGGELPGAFNWQDTHALAEEQGLGAIVLDGLEVLRNRSSNNVLPEKKVLKQWIGEVIQNFEHRYELSCKTISEMACFYNSHKFKMMVLKGFAASLNWPKPEHRPIGDIDIWQFGEQQKADALLRLEEGITVDKSHHHHTVFHWNDFVVENHYDFINVHHHKSNIELEKEFKKLGEDDTHFVKVFGEKVYLPSPNLHALFLLKHALSDFASTSMTLRQLLDWAFHVQKYSSEIDWNWLNATVEQYHMKDFLNCVIAICVDDLGFDADIFHGVQFDCVLKNRVLDDILHPRFKGNEPQHLLPRLVYKYSRWKGNAWKHKMCYNESMCSAFWSGVWNHLLKPKSI